MMCLFRKCDKWKTEPLKVQLNAQIKFFLSHLQNELVFKFREENCCVKNYKNLEVYSFKISVKRLF